MPSSSRKLRFFSFFAYGAVTALLLYLAFFQRGFNSSFGEVRLSGRYTPLPLFQSQKLGDLTLSYRGLDLALSRTRPLTVKRADGTISTFLLDSLRTFSDGVIILFEGGAAIGLKNDAGGGSSYTIAVSAPSAEPGTISLLIPFKAREAVENAQGAPVLSWGGGQGGILTLPTESRIDFSHGSLLLVTTGGGAAGEAHFVASPAGRENPYASWLSQEASFTDPQALRKRIDAFTDAAFAGWTQARLSSDGTLWKAFDGTFEFSEDIGEAMIVESIPRGSYLKYRSLYQYAFNRELGRSPQGAFTFSSSPFIGNLRGYIRLTQGRESIDVDKIRRLLLSSDLAGLLAEKELVPFLLDHGPFSLVRDAITLLERGDVSDLDPSTVLGALEAFLDYTDFVERNDPVSSKCRDLIEKGVLPWVRRTDKGIFLSRESKDIVDVADSVRAGSLLVRAGSALRLPVISSIGRSLIDASLRLAGDSGLLPLRLRLSGDAVAAIEGTLAPESVYSSLSDALDRRLPREIPLYGSLGPGTWIWTAAKIDVVEATASSLRIGLSFPAGLPHYIVVQGVKPFTRLELHGIAWRSDPEYAQYTDGWAYDAAEGTLFVKLTGKQDREEISIAF